MSRLPIRLRLTLAFAVAMAVVLAGVGLVRLRAPRERPRRDRSTRSCARARRTSRRSSARRLASSATRGTPVERGERSPQVLDAEGASSTRHAPIGGRAAVTARELGRAQREPVFVEAASVPGLDEPARLLAMPVAREGSAPCSSSAHARRTAPRRSQACATRLLIGGPLALLLASLCRLLARRRCAAAGRGDAPARGGDLRRARRAASRAAAHDEIARLGETLNEMLARIEEALERERRFVADASHELRTPLARC